jgi:hypothetical protein
MKWYLDGKPAPKVNGKKLVDFEKADYIMCAMVDELAELNRHFTEYLTHIGAETE